MKQRKLDILFLSEVGKGEYYHYVSDQYHFYISANKTYAGVGVVFAPHSRPYIQEVHQINSRIIKVQVRTAATATYLYGVYAPTQDPRYVAQREQFWNKLTNLVSQHCHTAMVSIFGDFNTRLKGRLPTDDWLGPYVLGPGPDHIDLQEEDTNRVHAEYFCRTQAYCFINILKATKFAQQVTYRDPGAPEKLDPQSDKLVTLDHVLAPRQWLPAFRQCKALPDISFPSDHYLAESLIAVKLGGKPPKPQPRFQLDYALV